MKKLLNKIPFIGDPVWWSAYAVGTWPRFFLFLLGVIIVVTASIFRIVENGFGWLSYLIILTYHLMFLIVIRNLFLKIIDLEKQDN
ncbi:MAG: hypothetical protein H8E26_03925 [FCB group bacterium]|nr:hypothetical protein [FCB group bacterium]MBL7028284.1 hypothetical protein [Candidatus Neomarinimicrobiota bacterium]MBL7121603.1 hypothetical protein [Candidatus Neomarinimicrobiota bacterium]